MSTVYRARDNVLERQVAVKLLAEHLSEDDGFVARFRREALSAAKLIHPNVVQVYDSGHDPEAHRHFIVMEYVEGPTVAQLMRERDRLPVDQAVDIAVQSCRRARVRAPARRDPQGREAGEPDPEPGRRGEAGGLRDREGGRGLAHHPDRLGRRNRRLPLARTGAGRGGHRQRRRLLAGRGPVPAAGRAAAVRDRLVDGAGHAPAGGRARAAAPGEPGRVRPS